MVVLDSLQADLDAARYEMTARSAKSQAPAAVPSEQAAG